MHRQTIKNRNLLKFATEKNRDFCYEIIKKAIVTSKSTAMELDQNTMCFVCPDWADKPVIKQCIENIFNAKVIDVRIINTKGRIKFFRGRKFTTNGYKKAIVRVNSIANMMVGFDER